ncbi:MAG: DUF2914 domain-containing protein [Gammaproteobacteria bacterium]|nr:DUF2914 domain-containing protein [Gammaproteobacteria bacterium]
MSTPDNSTLIDETVIDGLRPQARRYDVEVGNGLVLAILPNGAKTWTWVHEGPGQPHRQTLGIYPKMSLAEARIALDNAINAQRARDQREVQPSYVIRDGRIQSAESTDWRWPMLGAVAVLALGAVAAWLLLQDETPPEASATPTETLQLETRLESVSREAAPQATTVRDSTTINTGAEAALSATDTVAAEDAATLPDVVATVAVQPGDLSADEKPAPGLAAADAAIVRTPAAADLLAENGVTDSDDELPAAAEPATTSPAEPPLVTGAVDATDDNSARFLPDSTRAERAVRTRTVADTLSREAASSPGPDAVSSQRDPAVASSTEVAPIAITQPAPAQVTQAAPTTRPDSSANDVIGRRVVAGIDYEPGIRDPRIARAQLTTDVANREPVDQLGPVVEGNGQELQRFAFFTELRDLQGERIRHRWIAGDRIQAEISFNVGEAWRWRVFSRKQLLASLAGEWRVQVVTADDSVIYDYSFEFAP